MRLNANTTSEPVISVDADEKKRLCLLSYPQEEYERTYVQYVHTEHIDSRMVCGRAGNDGNSAHMRTQSRCRKHRRSDTRFKIVL